MSDTIFYQGIIFETLSTYGLQIKQMRLYEYLMGMTATLFSALQNQTRVVLFILVI